MNNLGVPTRYGVLEKFYNSFDYERDSYRGDYIPPNWLYLTRVALNARGLDMDWAPLKALMKSEGLTPVKTSEIPEWYRIKYKIR